jgi:hypothetical protein
MSRISVQHLLAVALLGLAACENPTHNSVQGTDRYGANTLDAYTSVRSASAWSIANDQLTGTGPADNALLLWNGVAFANGFIEVTTSRADDGGVVLKFQTDSSYYFMAIRDDGAPNGGGSKNLAIMRRTPTALTELWSTDLSWPRGTTHTARFEADHGTFRAYLDGAVVGQVSEPGATSIVGAFGVRHNGPNASWLSVYDELHWSTGQ